MRELKFRAWNTMVHKMQYFTLPDIEKQKGNIQWHIIDIMQYTGLKDKGGKEIYEGDILETQIGKYSNTAVVKFGDCYELLKENGLYGWYLEFIHSNFPTESKGCHLNNSIDVTIFVIGNIYENPDLLK
jgi:uncharacterized phage protein (TIGR01671 family)